MQAADAQRPVEALDHGHHVHVRGDGLGGVGPTGGGALEERAALEHGRRTAGGERDPVTRDEAPALQLDRPVGADGERAATIHAAYARGGEARAERVEFGLAAGVFGTPTGVTLAELSIEAFYPADAATAEFLRSAAD